MTPTDVRPVRLAEAVRSIPATCGRRSTARGLWTFGTDAGLFAMAFALLASGDPWQLAIGWPLAGVAWVWGTVFAVPWLLWNVLIGWTVYLHHIDPSIAWSRRGRWSKLRGQLDGTTTLDMPRWVDLLSHNVFHHVAHHVDPRIPFYHLPAASRALRARFGATIRSRRYDLRDYARITRRCKLFDFDRERWVIYPTRVAGSPSSPVAE